MINGDWYLGYNSYDDLPGAGLTFGRQSYGIDCITEPGITFSDGEAGDAPLPGEDGIRLGRDYRRTATVTFELAVDGVDGPVDLHWPWNSWANGRRIGLWSDIEKAMAIINKRNQGPELWASEGVDMLRTVWDAAAIRGRASRVAWLLHKKGGRTRRMYGRPRKFDVAHTRLERQGYVPCVAEFVSIDGKFYDDVEQTATMWDYYLGGRPARPGRPDWAPIVPPFTPAQKSVVISQKGRLATHPFIVIHGPCKNPKVSFPGLWDVQLSMTIAEDDHVTIDPRSWARTVIRTSGGSTASVADKLTRSSARLSQMILPPGRWPAILSYTRSTTKYLAGPKVEIKWRDAYAWW